MQLHQLSRKTKNAKKKLVGRGGKRGKTAGRGTKGQSARAGNKKRPHIRDIIKKIPKLRGRGKNSNTPTKVPSQVVTLTQLEKYMDAGMIISPKTLKEKGIIKNHGGKLPVVKILATGTVSKKFTIERCLLSTTARAAIEKAGGTVQ